MVEHYFRSENRRLYYIKEKKFVPVNSNLNSTLELDWTYNYVPDSATPVVVKFSFHSKQPPPNINGIRFGDNAQIADATLLFLKKDRKHHLRKSVHISYANFEAFFQNSEPQPVFLITDAQDTLKFRYKKNWKKYRTEVINGVIVPVRYARAEES